MKLASRFSLLASRFWPSDSGFRIPCSGNFETRKFLTPFSINSGIYLCPSFLSVVSATKSVLSACERFLLSRRISFTISISWAPGSGFPFTISTMSDMAYSMPILLRIFGFCPDRGIQGIGKQFIKSNPVVKNVATEVNCIPEGFDIGFIFPGKIVSRAMSG